MRQSPVRARILWVVTLVAASVPALRTQQASQAPTTAPRVPGGASGTAQPGAVTAPGQRGPNQPAKPPSAIVRGYVTSAAGGRPIRAAQVRLISAQPVIPGGVTVTARENRTIASEPDGHFEFKEVPAGRYRISAAKTGYVTFEYGQRAWNQPGTQIDVLDTQTVDHIDFTLQRGGVLVVTATNAHGEPLAGAQVTAMQWGFLNGRRQLTPAGGAETNDLGQARVYGLSPGEYYVNATSAFGSVGAANAKMSYAPTYYPGTLSTEEAQRVPVNVAEETSVSIPVMRARLATITGRVVKADGTPIVYAPPTGPPTANQFGNALVMRQEMPGGGFIQRNLATKADGSFSLPNLLPGNYEFQVRPVGNTNLMPRGSSEFAQVPIAVTGDDISNLVITTKPGAILSGQVTFDTGSPPTDKTMQEMRVFVYSNMVDPPLGAGLVTMNPDWSFEIRGVAMTGMVRLAVADTGWNVKEEIVDGKDIVEAPMTFEPGREYKDIRVLLTQKRAEVTGSATDNGGRPVQNFVALLFPQDKSRWVPRSLSVLVARSDQNGQFRIQRVPGAKYGSYNIIALDALAPGAEYDPELLARLAPLADKIALGETEVKTVTLRVQEAR